MSDKDVILGTTKISKTYKISIGKARRHLKVKSGDRVQFRFSEGQIIIEKVRGG